MNRKGSSSDESAADLDTLRTRFRKLARLAKDNGHEGERASAKAAAMLREHGDAVLVPPSGSPPRVGTVRKPRRESEKARLRREAEQAERLAESKFFGARSDARHKVRIAQLRAWTPGERAAAAAASKALEKTLRAELRAWNAAETLRRAGLVAVLLLAALPALGQTRTLSDVAAEMRSGTRQGTASFSAVETTLPSARSVFVPPAPTWEPEREREPAPPVVVLDPSPWYAGYTGYGYARGGRRPHEGRPSSSRPPSPGRPAVRPPAPSRPAPVPQTFSTLASHRATARPPARVSSGGRKGGS